MSGKELLKEVKKDQEMQFVVIGKSESHPYKYFYE
jgi:hypothetical protein